MVALLLNSCSTTIPDPRFCGLIPVDQGANCDNFLSHNPVHLDQAGWIAQIAAWNAAGQVVECTNSDAVGAMKAAMEKLCSDEPCNQATLEAKKLVLEAMEKSDMLVRLILQ